MNDVSPEDILNLTTSLKTRAEIRRSIKTRKSVQQGKPDRIADLCDEAASLLTRCWINIAELNVSLEQQRVENDRLRKMLGQS